MQQTHQEWLDGENGPESPLIEIKRIIKSNTRRHPYHRTIRISIENDELVRLNDLIAKLK